MGGYGAPAAAGSEMRGKDDMHMPWGDDWNKSDDELKGECCEMPRRNCYSIIKGKSLTCDVGAMRGKDDWHMPWGDSSGSSRTRCRHFVDNLKHVRCHLDQVVAYL